MAIERVDITGVRADFDEFGFDLGWEDDAGNFGIISFSQNVDGGTVRVDSEHKSPAFVIAVLHALGNNLEISL